MEDWDSTAPPIRDTELIQSKRKEIKEKLDLVRTKYTAISRFSNEISRSSSSSIDSTRNSMSRISVIENIYEAKAATLEKQFSTAPLQVKPAQSRFKIATPSLQFKLKPLNREPFKPTFDSQLFTGPPVYGPAKQIYGQERVLPIDNLSDLLEPKKDEDLFPPKSVYFSRAKINEEVKFWTQTSQAINNAKVEFDDRISIQTLSFRENTFELDSKEIEEINAISVASPPVETFQSFEVNNIQDEKEFERKRKKKIYILSLVLLITLILIAIIIGVIIGLILSKPKEESPIKTEITTILTTEPTTILTTEVTTILTKEPTTLPSTETTALTTQLPSTLTTLNCIIKATTTESYSQLVSSSFNCRSISAYVPSLLTLSDSFYFGFPIYQQVICFSTATTKFALICPENLFLHIVSAYFGIQSSTATSCVKDTKPTPAMCYKYLIFGILNNTCEYQRNCSIIVSPNALGDPCIGFKKQVFVQYQCMDLDTLNTINQCPFTATNSTRICPVLSNPSIRSNTFCEPIILSLQCTRPQVIKIHCAFYGIDTSTRCPGGIYEGAPSSCYSNDSLQLLKATCEGKTTCSLNGNPDFSGSGIIDACYGYSKAFYVDWECVQNSTSLTTSFPSTATSNYLPFCENFVKPNGTCPKFKSPYEPDFLNSSQLYSFGFPINQIFLCSGGQVNILCYLNTVIHIYAAYFGVQAKTMLSNCFSGSNEKPAKCYYSDGFKFINATCENKQMCSFDATVANLGDACPSFGKQLVVQYQCVDAYSLTSTISTCNQNLTVPNICPGLNEYNFSIKQQIWCDGDELNITCAEHEVIQIACAFFGIHPGLTECGIDALQQKPICYFESTFKIVADSCNNLNNCTFDSFVTKFGDPCASGDATNALFVQWKCF